MKKKIVCYVIAFMMLLSFDSAKALDPNACAGLEKTDLPTLSFSPVTSSVISKMFGEYFPNHSTTYYQMSLDGYSALCITPGAPARPGHKYTFNRVTGSGDAQYNMAFGFYISSDYLGSPLIKWAIAQLVAWEGLNSKTLTDIKGLIYRDQTIGYLSKGTIALEVAMKIRAHSNDKYYVWDNVTVAGGQQMVTALPGCPEVEENACPKGQMSKSDASLSCYVSKGGNTFTYSNRASSGDKSNVSVRSESGAVGLEMRQIGSFCRLYCEEYGIATLPGAIGESLKLGSYIIWPTSNSNNTNKFYPNAYPLKFKGELQCKIGVIPDKGLPFACERDPISEYSNYYNYVDRNKNNGTYNRTANVSTLEKLRLTITKWGPNDSAPSRSEVEASCTDAYNKNYTNLIYKYDYALELLEKAAEALAAAKKAEDAVSPKRQPKYCTDPIYGTHRCGEEDTSAYKAAKKVTAEKQAYYDQKLKIVNDIKNAINACTSYTHNFELARQILKEYKTCAEFTATTDLYNFSAAVNLSYSDAGVDDYGIIGDVFTEKLSTSSSGQMDGDKGLIEDKVKNNGLKVEQLYVQRNALSGDLTNRVNQIKSREFTIVKEMSYTLTTNYKFIDKETKKYLTKYNKGSNYSSLYTLIKKEGANELNKDPDSFGGVIPTSYNNEIAKNYWLTLSNISFGMAGFGMGSGDYRCPVQFTKVSNTTCICPEGTEMEGMDLISLIANNKMTCADAQLLYCDKKVDVPYEDMYCPNMPDVSIGACVNAGYTKDECIDKICTRKYTCKNTNGVSGKMDITSCVQTKIMQGLTEQQAIDYCDSVVCPIGKTIIYRTIRLENPFPSYDPSNTIYNGLRTGMFNNNTKGRYPGSNWNGILTVYNKIRNNRSDRLETSESVAINDTSTIGTTIYQTKEPLYTFVLNGDTIRTIRDYNESRVDGYNDFNSSKQNDNMDCKINNSTACVSAFVHNSKYGLTGGTCYRNTSKSNFYTCARR